MPKHPLGVIVEVTSQSQEGSAFFKKSQRESNSVTVIAASGMVIIAFSLFYFAFFNDIWLIQYFALFPMSKHFLGVIVVAAYQSRKGVLFQEELM